MPFEIFGPWRLTQPGHDNVVEEMQLCLVQPMASHLLLQLMGSHLKALDSSVEQEEGRPHRLQPLQPATIFRLDGVSLYESMNTLQRKSYLCIPFWKLRGLSPNFQIHVFVSDLYFPRIGPHIFCNRIGRSIVGIFKSLTDTWMCKLGLWPPNSFSGNIIFEFSVLVLCSA